jgi:hypothetical protein
MFYYFCKSHTNIYKLKKKKKKPFHETNQQDKLPYGHRITRLEESVNEKDLGAPARLNNVNLYTWMAK